MLGRSLLSSQRRQLMTIDIVADLVPDFESVVRERKMTQTGVVMRDDGFRTYTFANHTEEEVLDAASEARQRFNTRARNNR